MGKLLRLVIIFLALSILGLILFRLKFNEPIRALAETQVRNTTSDLINDAIDRQIEDRRIQYDRMIYLEKDLDGRITAIKTNMSEVNRLKTDILNLINDEILALETSDIGIHTGNILLPELFSGKGFMIPVQILAIRYSEATLDSSFTEAGINQTLHQLNMHISVDVTALVLGKTESLTISSQVIVAETVIVGQVPETLLRTGG